MSKTQSAAAVKPWNVAIVNDTEGEIILYGTIEEYTPWWREEDEMFITPAGFLEDLQQVAGKQTIKVRLNSSGGSLNTGIAIHNALKALPGKKIVIVEGLAASAASVIMCAGDEIQVYPGSMVMIHNPMAGINAGYYTAADLEKGINMLEAGRDAAVAIYKQKTGLDEDQIKAMMDDETWMTGEQAVENKFADALITGAGAVNAQMQGSDFLMVAGVKHDIRNLHCPDSLHIKQVEPVKDTTETVDKAPASGGDLTKGADNTMENNIKNVADLRASAPDLVQEIEAEAAEKAVAAERTRLKDIDSIASTIADVQMVEDAKFGENPLTAEQLALKAMQQQAALGSTIAQNMVKEADKSNVNKVTATADNDPVASDGSGTSSDDTDAKIKAGEEAAKRMKF